MSAVATRERSVDGAERGPAAPPAQRLFDPQGPTLEESILAIWRELASADRATCPVCSEEMTRAGGCSSCGAELN
jgi:hypothetical protein